MVGKKCVIKGHLLLRLGVGWGFISRALVIATAVYPKFMESFVCFFSTGCSVCYHLMIMFFICLPDTFDVTLQFLGWYHGWSGLEDNAHIGCCVIQMKHINEAQTRVVNVYMSCDWLSWCATVIPCSQQNPRCKKTSEFCTSVWRRLLLDKYISSNFPIFHLRFSTKDDTFEASSLTLKTIHRIWNALSLPDITGLGSRCRWNGRHS